MPSDAGEDYPPEYVEFCDRVGLNPKTVGDIAADIVGIAGRKGLVGSTQEEMREAYEHALRIVLISHLPEGERL